MSSHRALRVSSDASLEEAIVLALFDLANHLAKRGEQVASTAGLTTQQWLVLLHIARDPSFPAAPGSGASVLASDIADARGTSRASVSAIVEALRRQGLVRTEQDPDDKRRRGLVITRAGRTALASIEPRRRAANRRLLEQLPTADRQRFLRYLHSCLAVLWELSEDERVSARRRKSTARTLTARSSSRA